MDLPEKTVRAPSQFSLSAIGRAIVDQIAATAYRRAITNLNVFQLSRMGVGRKPAF